MKLNVGAGNKHLAGYLSVDIEQNPDPAAPKLDIVADIKSIPLPDNCAEEIIAIHVLEHIHRWDVKAVLKEWHRLLIPGGKLVIEMPDIRKAARNLLENLVGDGYHMWAFYGDPRTKNPLMCHKWGWTMATLEPMLAKFGFVNIVEEVTRFHSVGREIRDFRVEALKAYGTEQTDQIREG